MDSDSDVLLSNNARMDYLRKELARLENLVEKFRRNLVEKLARVQPLVSSQASAGQRRSVPRISTAGTVHSPAAGTSSSAVSQRDIRRRRSASNQEEAMESQHSDA